MNKELYEGIWNESLRLGCPFLRYHKILEMWVSQEEDPCPTKKCGQINCRNYGFPNRKREKRKLIILKMDK